MTKMHMVILILAGFINTQKVLLVYTGKLKNYFSFNGRISDIQSDGYIDRSNSDLKCITYLQSLTIENYDRTYFIWRS